MKGSAFKLGNVATKTALKQTKSPMKDTKTDPDNGNALEADKRHKETSPHHKSPTPMKSPLEQKKADSWTPEKNMRVDDFGNVYESKNSSEFDDARLMIEEKYNIDTVEFPEIIDHYLNTGDIISGSTAELAKQLQQVGFEGGEGTAWDPTVDPSAEITAP